MPLKLKMSMLGALCVAGVAVTQGGAAAGPVEQPPNIVVVMTDDQDVASMRVMKQTRKLLANRGVTFSRHYATFPLCCPSRASYLSGQYSHNHGVTENRGFPDFDDSATSVVALRNAGYRTAWIGKYLNGYPNYGRAHPQDIPDGYTRWFAGITGRMFNWVVNDDGKITHIKRTDANYQTDVYTRQGRRFMRQSMRADKPFFLTLAPLAPHGEPKRGEYPDPRPAPRHNGAFAHEPLPHPPSFNEADVDDKPEFVQTKQRLDRAERLTLRDRHRARLASLLAIDDMVRVIVEDLKAAGELQNTYIMFTSDNGFLLGEHRLSGKTFLYEESAKVPMILRGPGLADGAEHDQPTANIDLAATIYDATGVAPLTPPDGVSLLPAAQDPDAPTGRMVVLENRNSTGIEDGRYVYIEHDLVDGGGIEAYELYDLEEDPFQLNSVHDDPAYAGIRSNLANALDGLRNCAGSACY